MSGFSFKPKTNTEETDRNDVPASNDSTCTEACMKLVNSQIGNKLTHADLEELRQNYLKESKCWLRGKDTCPYNIAVRDAKVEDMKKYLDTINKGLNTINKEGGKRKSLRSHKKSKKRKQTKHMRKGKNGKKSKTQKVKRSRH